jgi:hypothetical protein
MTLAHTRFALIHLPRDICPWWLLPIQHLLIKTFDQRTLAKKTFAKKTTAQRNICPKRQLPRWRALSQMSLGANVFLGKCLFGQMSFLVSIYFSKFLRGKYISGQMSFYAKSLLGKCLSKQLSFWVNVFLGKWLMGKCTSGQMSLWENVLWANVYLGNFSGQICPGANVVSPWICHTNVSVSNATDNSSYEAACGELSIQSLHNAALTKKKAQIKVPKNI